MIAKVSATARVSLTIEISVGDSWGEDCKMDQVYRQAADSAIGRLQRIVSDAKVVHGGIRVIGEPKVTAILTERIS